MKIWDPRQTDEKDAEEVPPEKAIHLLETLVEEWAEEDDENSAEFTARRTVFVRDDGGALHAFLVEGEAVPQYTAFEQEPE